MSVIERLTGDLASLPGIGPKTALRLVHHLMKRSKEDTRRLARSLVDLADRVANATCAETSPSMSSVKYVRILGGMARCCVSWRRRTRWARSSALGNIAGSSTFSVGTFLPWTAWGRRLESDSLVGADSRI